jgi:hypothetical protein
MIMPRHQNAGKNDNLLNPINHLKICQSSNILERRTYSHEEIKSRLNSWNTCYHSVQNVLPSRLLSKSFGIKKHKTVISPVFVVV